LQSSDEREISWVVDEKLGGMQNKTSPNAHIW